MNVDDVHHGGPAGARDDANVGSCRVTVLAGRVEVDLSLPPHAEIGALVPGIADLVNQRRRSRGLNDGVGNPGRVSLATSTGVPLPDSRTLADMGVGDGDVIVLVEDVGSAAPPLFDDVTYGVADLSTTSSWDRRSAATAAAVLVVAWSSLIAFASWRASGSTVVPIAVSLVVATLCTASSCAFGTVVRDRVTSLAFGIAALPVSFAAGVLTVPDSVIAPDVALGSALALLSAVVSLRFSTVGRAVYTAAAVAGAGACTSALVVATTTVDARDAAVAAGCIAVVAFAWAPRITIVHSRIPLPTVPVGEFADDADAGTTHEAVRSHARRGRDYLTGYVVGLSVIAGTAALACAAPVGGTVSLVHVGTAAAFAVASILRGRTYVDRVQAAAGIVSGSVVLVGLGAGAAILRPGDGTVVAGIGLFAVVVTVLVGVVAPARTFSPVVRRAAELAEFGVLVAIVPLTCWALDLFAAVRAL